MLHDVTLEQETDGRWIAAVEAIPGAMAYGSTRDEAVARVEALVLRVLARIAKDTGLTPGDL